MKKLSFVIPVIIVSLTFFSCFPASEKNKTEETTTSPAITTTTTEEIVEGTIDIPTKTPDERIEPSEVERTEILPLSDEVTEFTFTSGAGAWSTSIRVSPDGSFSGEYHDSEMGLSDVEFPKGSVYICSFRGVFGNIEKIDDYSYRMILTDLDMYETPGEEWIEDGIKYIASTPYGIDGGREFIFYLPETPVGDVDEEFLTWWPNRYDNIDNPKATLDYYGILNVNTGEGFFG